MNRQKLLVNLTLGIILGVVSLVAMEGAIRIKNATSFNYDIEMWRYSKDLKQISEHTVLGHEHVPNREASLQGIDIRTNAYGLRGGAVKEQDAANPHRRILFLGSSITLGWGVAEEDTLTALLQARFDEDGARTEVLNAGIGNYNTQRYVERYFLRLMDLNPSDIVIHYFLNDAEVLPFAEGNFIMRNSQLAVTSWIMFNRIFAPSAAEGGLVEHYRAVYEPDAEGYQIMVSSLEKLRDHAEERGIRLYLAITPDVHNLSDYPFGFIHAHMEELSDRLGYTFIDLLPAFEGIDEKSLWAMPGDPHPNELGHRNMADALYPALSANLN